MKVEQYVMAYSADHNEIKKLVPPEYQSLRPVLRINAEILDENAVRVEFNTPVFNDKMRGWLNMVTWENSGEAILSWKNKYGITKAEADIKVERINKATRFVCAFRGEKFLEIEFKRAGVRGGCPKENDNTGTYMVGLLGEEHRLFDAEKIQECKEYCDCIFNWIMPHNEDFVQQRNAVKHAMSIKCDKVLGAYAVEFERN